MKKLVTVMCVILCACAGYATVVMDLDFSDKAGAASIDDIGKLDYTREATWDGSLAAANTLGMVIGSATTRYEFKDGGAGHGTVLYNTGGVNFSADENRSIYFAKLDMTSGGANGSQVVRVSWSFDIVGASADSDFLGTGWSVLIDSNNVKNDYDLNNDGSSGYTSLQTFDVENAGKGLANLENVNWTTVTGFYDVAIGEGSTLGMLKVHPNSSGYLGNGEGTFAIDNIYIDITAVSDPSLAMNINFSGDIIGTTNYIGPACDYQRAAQWDGALASANSLGLMIGASSSQYLIRDGGTGHGAVLYQDGGGNLSLEDRGLYLAKLDMTVGGANATQPVRVSWSFDIVGASSDSDFIGTGWEVRINPTNSASDVALDGVGYTYVQTFSVENAGQNLNNIEGVNWTTVVGSYDIPVGMATSLGVIQVHGNSAGYLSSGKGSFAVDNIKVSLAAVPDPIELGYISIDPAGTNIVISWANGNAATTYTLQSKSSLHDNAWSNLTENISGLDGLMSVTNGALEPVAFYRVVGE